MEQNNKFVQDITIPCYCTDVNARLKPSSFMDMMQEIAHRAATKLNFGYDALQTHHTAWVLSRMHFIFGNPPSWNDEVQLQTWHKGLDGLMFLRDFRMTDRQGRELLTCTSSWLVIDTLTRRLVRSDALTDIVGAETQCKEDAIAQRAPKLVMPSGDAVQKVAEHRVSYSDMDLNGHANNVSYIVWAMDCIDYGELMEKGVRDVKVNFNKETVAGDCVELYSARFDDAQGVRYIVEGKVASRQVFISEITLGK